MSENDVSWNVLAIGFRTATFVPGVVAHTRQAAASAGMSIGPKGMIVAAKALAVTGADLFLDRQLVLEARADFRHQMEGKTYQSVMPAGQKPPLNYRNKQAAGAALTSACTVRVVDPNIRNREQAIRRMNIGNRSIPSSSSDQCGPQSRAGFPR